MKSIIFVKLYPTEAEAESREMLQSLTFHFHTPCGVESLCISFSTWLVVSSFLGYYYTKKKESKKFMKSLLREGKGRDR